MTTVLEGTLALSGAGTISNKLILYGGATFDTGGCAVTLARLDVHGSATYDGNLDVTGGALNFYLPTTAINGGILQTVTGNATIDSSAVNVGIAGSSSALAEDNTVTLIEADAPSAIGINFTANGQGMQSVTLKYEFALSTDANKLYATVNSVGLNEQSKTLAEGHLAGMATHSAGPTSYPGQA